MMLPLASQRAFSPNPIGKLDCLVHIKEAAEDLSSEFKAGLDGLLSQTLHDAL